MPPPASLHHHRPLFASPSPSQALSPFTAFSRRLHQPSKPLAVFLHRRPLVSSSPFAVAAVDDDEDVVIGDCLVFDEDAFEAPKLELPSSPLPARTSRPGRKASVEDSNRESLVPDKWRDAEEEINLTKKEKRRIAHGLRFGSRLERRAPPAVAASDEFRAYREGRLQAELEHVASVYRGPLDGTRSSENVEKATPPEPGTRVAPRNPRMGMDVSSFEDITELFNSEDYEPREVEDGKNPKSRRKLFTNEEKVLLNKRVPDLEAATSSKWVPLHTIAASGDFYLLDSLLKYYVDINMLDKDGATLMHYAVQTACIQTIKTLLLYNVDINRPDDYGWTPLHLAVQTQRTDIVKLLLIKGADRTLKTQNGLAPLGLCLRLGHHVKTYEIIELLKNFQGQRQHIPVLHVECA